MENPTLEVLTKLRSEIDSAMGAITTAKKQTSSVADSIKRMKDDGAFDLLVERYTDLASDGVSCKDDLVSEFELTIDYGNTVEIADYSVNTDSVEDIVKDALTDFLDEILFQLTHEYA